MFGNPEKRMRVCVEDIKARNEGKRNWVWIELPADRDEIWEQIDEMLGDNEEWEVTDWEGFSDIFDWNRFMNVDELNHISKIIREHGREVVKILAENYGINEAMEILEEDYNYIVIKEPYWADFKAHNGDLARELHDRDLLGLQLDNENLRFYFDWEKYERDLLLEANIIIGDGLAIEIFDY